MKHYNANHNKSPNHHRFKIKTDANMSILQQAKDVEFIAHGCPRPPSHPAYITIEWDSRYAMWPKRKFLE
ncbi:hypothetical protein SLA2020_503180 [Shorea laevis]